MRRLIAPLAMLLMACSQTTGTPVAHVTPTSGQTASSSPSPSLATSTPQATSGTMTVPDLPLSFPTFACTLPIATPDSGQAAFVAVGSTGAVTFVSGQSGVHYYDRAFSKWLPVSRNAISPDGAHYAYIDVGDSDAFFVHIVDVPSGADHSYRELRSSAGLSAQGIGVFDYAPEGIYLAQAFEHIWPDVWLFDPRTNTIRKAATMAVPMLRAGGGIWYGDVNPADNNPLLTGSSAGILSDEIFRYDLKTGTRTRWLYRPGDGLHVLGVDTSGRPLIVVWAPKGNVDFKSSPIDDAATELLEGLDPSNQRSIFKGVLVENLGAPIADAHGVWFGSTQGIYLYAGAGGLQKIANQPGNPANGCY